MDESGRQELFKYTMNFIQSPDFLDYLRTLYKRNSTSKLISLQKIYLESMQNANVEMAFMWMVNSKLQRGKVLSAPGLLISGAQGTQQSENYVQSIYMKIGTQEFPSPAIKEQVGHMLNDEVFQFGRARTLPLDFTDNYPVYLLDTQLTYDCVGGEKGGEINPLIPCFVNPAGEVKVFAIPHCVIAAAKNNAQSIPQYKNGRAIQKNNDIATTSLTIGLISLLLFFLGPIALILGGFMLVVFVKGLSNLIIHYTLLKKILCSMLIFRCKEVILSIVFFKKYP